MTGPGCVPSSRRRAAWAARAAVRAGAALVFVRVWVLGVCERLPFACVSAGAGFSTAGARVGTAAGGAGSASAGFTATGAATLGPRSWAQARGRVVATGAGAGAGAVFARPM